jgi:hypothetical protein
MEKLEQLKNIIRNAGMSTRPEYFSGRGATLADLDSEILQKIYQGIIDTFGTKAAKSFVDMVAKIKVLSATTFLEELYLLQINNWKLDKTKKDEFGVSVPKKENDDWDINMGMIGMMNALSSGGGPGQTSQIRSGFLRTHGVKPATIYDHDNGIMHSVY